jgi:hypothetical protein
MWRPRIECGIPSDAPGVSLSGRVTRPQPLATQAPCRRGIARRDMWRRSSRSWPFLHAVGVFAYARRALRRA